MNARKVGTKYIPFIKYHKQIKNEKEIANDRRFCKSMTNEEFIKLELETKPRFTRENIVDVLIKYGYISNSDINYFKTYAETLEPYKKISMQNEYCNKEF